MSWRWAPYVQILRPLHWVKSVFVLLPVPFAVAAGAPWQGSAVLAGVAGFALLSSAVYVGNDLVDRARDRLHPAKRLRPLASGILAPGLALRWSVGVALVGMGLLVAWAPAPVWWPVLSYLALQAAYTGGAKHVPFLDVFLLSGGYVLRAWTGCALVGVRPSGWLLLCSSTLALFVAFAKRRGDLVAGVGGEHRPSLAGYSRRTLDLSMAIAAAIALLCYGLYSRESPALKPGRELVGVLLAGLGIFEYLRLCYFREGGADPVRTALRSPILWVAGLGYVLATLWGLGLMSRS